MTRNNKNYHYSQIIKMFSIAKVYNKCIGNDIFKSAKEII
jgi:hypothetical protein